MVHLDTMATVTGEIAKGPVVTHEYFAGGYIASPAWAGDKDWKPAPYAPPYSPSDPGTIPDSLCPNCRRDRHDYPLTETVAEMWKSLAFDEGYDPDNDDSRIVCPGSDVCGPVVYTSTRMTPGYYTTTVSTMFTSDAMKKYWESFSFDTESLKVKLWTADWSPKWELSPAASWTIDELNELKGGFQLAKYTYPDTSTVTANDLYAFAPVDQAAIEAAPKQIEYEAPQPVGFDFSNIKSAYPTYPTGKKKKK